MVKVTVWSLLKRKDVAINKTIYGILVGIISLAFASEPGGISSELGFAIGFAGAFLPILIIELLVLNIMVKKINKYIAGVPIKLNAEEEHIVGEQIMASLTPEQIERLERLGRGEAVPGRLLDLDAEKREIDEQIIKLLTPDEIERLNKLDRGEKVPTIDLTDFLENKEDKMSMPLKLTIYGTTILGGGTLGLFALSNGWGALVGLLVAFILITGHWYTSKHR